MMPTASGSTVTGELWLSDQAVWQQLEPFVVEEELLSAREARVARVRATRARLRQAFGPRRTVDYVAERYTEVWKERSFDVLEPTGKKPGRVSWQNRHFRSNPHVIKRVHIAQLIRIIGSLQPRSVLEVGCGQGINLSILSRRFPDVRFGGLELTETGSSWARRLTNGILPSSVQNFAPEEIDPGPPPIRPDIVCASAGRMPYRANSFDLVYTVQALEQMERIRPHVLGELARVAERHVCMFEAFAEWNGELHKKLHLRAKGYWRGRVSRLSRASLTPIAQKADFPHKIHMNVGCVLCVVEH